MLDPERLTVEPLTDLEGEDGARLIDILRTSFGGRGPDAWRELLTRLGSAPGGPFVARLGGEVAGGYAIYDMGQFWGGRSVKLAGFSVVGIEPQLRGRGLASRMMRLALRRLRGQGFPLAGLYASTMPLYRKVGFEQAGVKYRYRLDLARAGIRREDHPLVRVAPDDPRFEPIYRRWVTDGNLDRNATVWWRVSRQGAPGEHVHAYLAGPPGAEDGYVVVSQEPPSPPWGFRITVRDFVALNGRAARRLWALLGSLSTVGRTLHWCGPALDPRLGHIPDCHPVDVEEPERSFLRVLDVRAALEARGYPDGVAGGLELEVADADLPENAGRWVLEVADGRGVVREGGAGAVRLDVRGLASLYSGFLSPRLLRRNDWLEADDASVAVAARLFAGDPPWTPDHY